MSERIDARQTTPASAAKHANGVQETLGKRVRERNSPLPSADTAGSTLPRPAHPSNRLLAQLNERWRVVDDPLQWRLQKKKGNLRDKNSGWDNRSFCRTKDDLLRCIREHCCSPDQGQLRSIREYNGVDKVALQQVRALPDWHPDCDRQNDHTNLDVLGTDEAHSGVQGIWRLRCWRIAIRKSSLCSLLD